MKFRSIALIRNLNEKQSMQRKHAGSPPPKKFKRVSSAGKVMASIIWDNQGAFLVDYLEEGRTINGAYYAEELRWLRQETARKRVGKLSRGVLLLQDNAPAQTPQVAMAAATECGFEILPHPPYSPDLAPSDFYLFPKLKTNLRGRIFGNNEGVMDAVNEYLGETSILKGIRNIARPFPLKKTSDVIRHHFGLLSGHMIIKWGLNRYLLQGTSLSKLTIAQYCLLPLAHSVYPNDVEK